jgi:hypothetical protein
MVLELDSKMRDAQSRAVVPDDDCIANGTKLICQIHRGPVRRNGEVKDEQGSLRWSYATRANPSGGVLGNPLNKPDFVFAELDEKDETIIRRVSLIPSTFDIVESGAVIGTIRMRSIFRNEYSISIEGVNSWTFRMPLFTVLFFGESGAGFEIWVRVGPSEREWNLLIKPGVAQRSLVAALAFLHNERYFYS